MNHVFPCKTGNTDNDNECDVCSEHYDTGILTFAFASASPGLEFFDKHSKKWVKIEEMVEEKDIVCFLSRKFELFSKSKDYPSLLHRVIVPPKCERYSIVFLLDVAK